MAPSYNGWNENQKLVLSDLERLQDAIEHLDVKSEERIEKLDLKISKRLDKIDRRCVDMEIALAELKAVTRERARIWGLQGAIIPSVLAIILSIVGFLQ